LHFGWRGIFGGFGVIILCAAVILYFFLEEPARTIAPPLLIDEFNSQPVSAPMQMEGMTTAEALRGKTLWIMIAAGLVTSIFGYGWNQHSFAFQLSRGFGWQPVVNVLSFSLLIAPLATLFGGWMSDKAQTAKIYIPFALIAGYFYTRFFGMKSYGEIAGINMAAISLIGGFSAPLIGILFERTGSYDWTLFSLIGRQPGVCVKVRLTKRSPRITLISHGLAEGSANHPRFAADKDSRN
jgi:hypothetical protein